MNPHFDVAILGGGLAGLTLALQLQREQPDLRITVLERNVHPVPEAAFKVGESTVEIAAHYFGSVLGLRQHLDSEQIRKFGFRFFFSEGIEAIDRTTELGVSKLLPMTSWQIDRGRFENFLVEHVRALNVDVHAGAVVKQVHLDASGGMHQVAFEQHGERHTLDARWVIDASGRAGLLKRKLGLGEDNPHDVNAVWWRVDGILQPNDWSRDAEWLARCQPPDRWRSTNHLCGRGYWVWMIPLSSDAHSLGIVADGQLHPLDTLKTHVLATQWLERHQPALAALLADPAHTVQDFRFLRHFAHGSRKLYSTGRWAITGEAGLFLDPFYSPGSDFIAISNTYVCELIRRDMAGEPFAPHTAIFEQLVRSFFDNTMTLYRGQYAIFGDAAVMPLKIIWDYTYYWSLLAPLFTSGHIANITLLARLRPALDRAMRLNIAMQALLRDWCKHNGNGMAAPPLDGRLLDQYRIPWFHDLNRALTQHDGDDAASVQARLEGNVALMEQLAVELLTGARHRHPDIDTQGIHAMTCEVTLTPEALLSAEWTGL